ncbi:hypothetical protein ABHF33_07160 [Chitinibacter sp. FCG-7]|uniref:Uncharacterized protein n=1 Tax=Chitinibacter mangrovi TaxID=3153927 RepID=A0AAU7FEJ2_9NEIS
MQRGKIIQYNNQSGEGVISVDGKQHDFTIKQWHSDVAPNVNRLVDVGLLNGVVSHICIVPDDVLVREKAAELTGKFGAMLSQSNADSANNGLVANLLAAIGKPALIAIAVYFISTLFLPAIETMGRGAALWDALTYLGSGWKFMLFVAWFSPAIPFFIPNKNAVWSLALPLFVILGVTWSVYSRFSGYNVPFFDLISRYMGLGLGYYLALASSAFLALCAFKKWAVQSA